MLSQDSADSGVTLDPHRDPSFAKFFKSGDVEFYRRDYEGVIRHTVGADRLKEGSINYPTLYLVKVDDQGDTVGKVTYLYTFKKNYTNGVSSRCRIRGDPCMGKIEQISDMDVQGVEYDAVIDIPNTNGEIVFECRGDGYVRYRTPQSYYFQGFIVDGGDNDPIITTIKSQSSGMFHSGSYLSYTVVNPNNAASLGSLSVGDGEGGVTEGSVNNNFRIYVVYPKDEKQQVKLLHYFVGCDDASRQKLDSDHILSAETYFTNDTNHAMLSSKYTPTQLTLTQGDDINEADELSVLHALITERDKIKESLPQLFSNVSKAEKDEESKVLLFKEAYYEAAARLAEIEKESAARDEARNVSPADTGIPAATAVDDKVAASDKAAIDDSDKVAIGDDKSAAVIPPNEEMLVDLRRQTKERDEAIAAKEAADEELRIAWGRIKELEAKLDARTGEGDDEIESEKSYTALSQTKWSYDVAMSQLKSNMKKNHNIDDLNLFENQVMVINSGTSIYIGIPPGQFDDLPRTCCKEKQINKQRVVFYHEVKYKDKLDNVFELVKTESEKVLNESSSRDDVLRIATESLLTDKIQAKLKKSIPVVPGGEHSILQYYAIRYQLYDHKRRNNEIPCLCFDPNCNERMDRRTHSVVGSISGKCATKWINLRPSALGEGVDFSFCDDPYSGKEDCRVMFTGLYHASTLLASKRIAVTFHGTVVERLIRSRITEIRAGKKVINERHTSTRSVLDKNAARKRASNAKKKKKKLLAPVLVEVDGKKGIFQPELTKSKLRYAILVFGNALAKAMEAAKDGRFALLGYISDTTMDENGNPMANEQFRHLVRVDNNPVILQGPKGNGQKLRLEHIGTPEEAEMNEQILLPITVVSVETLGGLEGETLERKLQKYFIKNSLAL